MAISSPKFRPLQLRLPELSIEQRRSAGAMARLLTISFAFGAAAVPAFVAGVDFVGWALAGLSASLVLRFPMSALLANIGGGAYLILTAVALLSPTTFGPSGLLQEDPWMRACSWITLVASALAVGLMDARTFQETFRREGRPVASWNGVGNRPKGNDTSESQG